MTAVSLQPNPSTIAFKRMAVEWARRWNALSWYHGAYETQIGMD